MSELNRKHLLELRAWAEKEIERIEIRQANEPMYEATLGQAHILATKTAPDVMAGPMAEIRKSVIQLEESLRNSDARRAEANGERQRRLERARAQTDALREWLEVLA